MRIATTVRRARRWRIGNRIARAVQNWAARHPQPDARTKPSLAARVPRLPDRTVSRPRET